MERGSTQHSARVDDALDADTSALTHGVPHEEHIEENRWQEGPADDEPAPDGLLVGDAQPSPFVDLGLDDMEVRSELARSLRPGIFPATGPELLACARDEGAFEWAIDALSDLPMDSTYETVQAVWVALGGPVEQREHEIEEVAPAEVSVAELPVPTFPDADLPPDESLPSGSPLRMAAPVFVFAARVVGFGLRATAAALDAAGRKLGA